MGIQDDIFDVQHALKRKPEMRKAFRRILDLLYMSEDAAERNAAIIDDLSRGLRAVNALSEPPSSKAQKDRADE